MVRRGGIDRPVALHGGLLQRLHNGEPGWLSSALCEVLMVCDCLFSDFLALKDRGGLGRLATETRHA